MRLEIRGTLNLVGFLFELLAELMRHRARPPEPFADGASQPWQLFGTQDQQGNHENDHDFGKVDAKHGQALGSIRDPDAFRRARQAWTGQRPVV